MKDFFKKLGAPILIQIIFTVFYSVTVALFPVLNKYLFDYVLDNDYSFILLLIILYISLIVLNIIFQYVARIYEWKVTKKFNLDIKRTLFLHIVSLKDSNFKKKKPTDYLVIFNNNVEVIDEDYISAYIDLIKSVINIIIFASALLIFVDWRITFIVIVTSIITAFVPRIMQKKLSSRRKEQLNKLSNYYSNVLDFLNGKKNINRLTINAFLNEHMTVLREAEDSRYSFGKTKTISDLINAIGVFFIELCTFIMVAILLLLGKITVGTGIAAFGYVKSFLTPIRNILECINLINSTQETVEETLSYLDNSTLVEKTNKTSPEKINKLELKDISYEVGQFKLQDINISFEIGKKYAIAGHSGSGKTTLMKILQGTLEPRRGHILVNTQDIRSLNIEDIIFSVDQHEHLFNTSFTNNVTIYNSNSVESEHLDKSLKRLKEQTQSRLTKYKSVNELSGGEKQIICILRMLVADKTIILLDESFSSIDINNRKLIKDYIHSLDNKIVIEVTHDLSKNNLKTFDEVLFIENGCLKGKQTN